MKTSPVTPVTFRLSFYTQLSRLRTSGSRNNVSGHLAPAY